MTSLPWSDIPSGKDAIPVSEDASTPHRFMWALQSKRYYTLLYLINSSESEALNIDLPRLQCVDVFVTPSSPCYLAISLLDSSYADIFLDLCNDLIGSTMLRSTRTDGLTNLINRCWRWQSLFYKRGSPLLSTEEQQGLFSELSFLVDSLVPSLGIRAALEMWQGPYGSFHDFVSKNYDVEIKSFRTIGTPRMRISSEYQLERPLDKRLYLACFALIHDNSVGISLTSLAERLSTLIADGCPSCSGLFQSLLDEAGFAWTHDYEGSRWSIRSQSFYEVADGFPTINRAMLDMAITHVEYDLNPLLLASYAITVETLIASLV